MAFLSVIVPRPNLYVRTMLYGVGRAESDTELRANLRLIAACLLAEWYDEKQKLNDITGQLFDMVTSEFFFANGYAKSKFRDEERLWFCSYVGFEKVTSAWAKKHHPGCKGYISMRVYNQDARHVELDSHTIQIYF